MLPIIVCDKLLTDEEKSIQNTKFQVFFSYLFTLSRRLPEQQGYRALNFPHKIRCVRAQAHTHAHVFCCSTKFALHVNCLYPVHGMSSVPYTIAIFHWIFPLSFSFYLVLLSQFTVVGDSVVALHSLFFPVTLLRFFPLCSLCYFVESSFFYFFFSTYLCVMRHPSLTFSLDRL